MEESQTDRELLLEIHRDVKALLKSDEKLRKTVFGNGDVGLVDQAREAKREAEAIKEMIRTRDRIAIYAVGGFASVFSIILGLVITLLWNIFTGQIQIVQVAP